jgi:hypothetical protein
MNASRSALIVPVWVVVGEVGRGEGDDAVVVRLGAAQHALAPPVLAVNVRTID